MTGKLLRDGLELILSHPTCTEELFKEKLGIGFEEFIRRKLVKHKAVQVGKINKLGVTLTYRAYQLFGIPFPEKYKNENHRIRRDPLVRATLGSREPRRPLTTKSHAGR